MRFSRRFRIHCPLGNCAANAERVTRSSLHRLFQRHGISRLPDLKSEAEPKRKFKSYPIHRPAGDAWHRREAATSTLVLGLDPGCARKRANCTCSACPGPRSGDATVKRYHYESHGQLREHLQTFVNAHNFAKRLKTLRGLTPFEYVTKRWTEEPERFYDDPSHQMSGLNS